MTFGRVEVGNPALRAIRQEHLDDLVGAGIYAAAEVVAMASGQFVASWITTGAAGPLTIAAWSAETIEGGVDIYRLSDNETWLLESFVIAKRARHKGLGRGLYNAAVEEVRSLCAVRQGAVRVRVYSMARERESGTFWKHLLERNPELSGNMVILGATYDAVGWEERSR